MAGTVLITGANSSSGLYAVEHLLSHYPKHTLVLTVRDASASDPNTERLRAIVGRFPDTKASIRALDLSSLNAVREFAVALVSEVEQTSIPRLVSIVAIAYYWNLVGDPEMTADGFDKTIQVSHISHAALILRLLGVFAETGRVVLLSSDSHWPGKNSMEKYPPVIPVDGDGDHILHEMIMPTGGEDKQGLGYRRYATAKLAITTWMYALNRHLQKSPRLAGITAVAMNPGNLVDSRALTTNTPPSLHWMQRFVLKPLLPVLRLAVGRTLRTAEPAGVDIAELAVNPKFDGQRGFYTLLEKDESSPESCVDVRQEKVWRLTLEWTGVGKDDTVL